MDSWNVYNGCMVTLTVLGRHNGHLLTLEYPITEAPSKENALSIARLCLPPLTTGQTAHVQIDGRTYRFTPSDLR